MAIKLPPKLPAPYALNDWLALGYDKDPKFTKNHKQLGKVLIALKKTRPPTAEAFQEFTECTAYAIKRIRKLLKAPELPEAVLEFCQPFLKILLKWQKGAVKAQDIIMEADEENAAETAAMEKGFSQAARQAESCMSGYIKLAGAVQKRRKELDTLGKVIKSGASSAKIDALIKGLRGGALVKSLEVDYGKCANLQKALPDDKALRIARQSVDPGKNAGLAKQIQAVSVAVAGIDKIARQIEKSLAECGRTVEAILKAYDSR
ncbi:hypothetical protein OH491_02155 [Termitidicoccus mucosus]|uniref:Uncharacterized protein n=1 Tax=Termitidicoccus mucosus TaxID=1184151 RepID=A0A178IN41_9BACT|nr:hypothetical protein AW736_07400 [Opitutaceae bacterium TSB47]